MSDVKIPAIIVSGQTAQMGESLSAIRQFITNAAQQAGLDKQATYRLILAVDEIATNIFTYGYRDEHPDPKIRIHAVVSDASLTVTLEDSAGEFDPSKHQVKDELGSNIEDRTIGGLGVYLALSNVDDFRYERIDGRNCNSFTMKRRSAG